MGAAACHSRLLNLRRRRLLIGVASSGDVDGADDYLVQWRRHGPGQALNAGVRPTSSSTQITVAGYGRWVVRVQACNTAGCGRASAVAFTAEAPPEPPGVPADFEINAADGSFDVEASWDDTETATTYKLTWRQAATAGKSARNSGLPGDSLETALATATVAGSGQWLFSLTACNKGDCAAGATACRIGWDHIDSFAGIYRIYLWADLEQDPASDTAVCDTRSKLIRTLGPGKPQDLPVTAGIVSFATPSDLPACCKVEEWVASVVAETIDAVLGTKHSSAALAYRDHNS